MKYIPNAMKCSTQSRSCLLITNMIFEIVDGDPKLQTWADLVSKLQVAPIFMKFGTRQCLEQLRDYWLRIIVG